LVEGVQPAAGPVDVRGGVEVAQLLAGDVGGGDLTLVTAGDSGDLVVKARELGARVTLEVDDF